MVCTLSVNAIKAYAEYNRNKANGNELGGKIIELKSAVSGTLSALDSECNWLRERYDAATENIKYYYDLCSKKVEEIRSYYNKTPETRTVKCTKTVEVINADGSKATRKEEYTKTYDDPYHDKLKQMLEQAEAAKHELENLRSQCWDCKKYLDDFYNAKKAFENSSQNAIRVVENVEKSVGEHLNSLAAQSMEAADCIISAREACGPFPAIQGSGTVDLDGLDRYICDLQSKLEVCTAEANKLVYAAEDLNSGWSDGVYTIFFNKTIAIRNEVISIVKDLGFMKDALMGMYDELKDYAAIIPRVDFQSVYFSYESVSLSGQSSSSSVSAELKI